MNTLEKLLLISILSHTSRVSFSMSSSMQRNDTIADPSTRAQNFVNAAQAGNLELLKTLKQQGAQIDSLDNQQYTALHQAAFNGHLQPVNYLILHRASLEAQDNNGRTPFHAAAYNDQTV